MGRPANKWRHRVISGLHLSLIYITFPIRLSVFLGADQVIFHLGLHCLLAYLGLCRTA